MTTKSIPESKSPHRLIRIIAIMALMFAGLVFASTATAGSASAVSCPGSLVKDYGDSVSELVVYYSGASGGTNCAGMNHLGAAYGQSLLTSVDLWTCSNTSPSATCNTTGHKYDQGYYAYYAGPVTFTGTAGRCIAAVGDMDRNGNSHAFTTSPFATACG